MTLSRQVIDGLDSTELAVLRVEDIAAFGDLYWDDVDILALEKAALLEQRVGYRQFVVQRIRGELRYWATMDRRPEVPMDGSVVFEIGTMASVDAAKRFCHEFLVEGLHLSQVPVPRSVLRRGLV